MNNRDLLIRISNIIGEPTQCAFKDLEVKEWRRRRDIILKLIDEQLENLANF